VTSVVRVVKDNPGWGHRAALVPRYGEGLHRQSGQEQLLPEGEDQAAQGRDGRDAVTIGGDNRCRALEQATHHLLLSFSGSS